MKKLIPKLVAASLVVLVGWLNYDFRPSAHEKSSLRARFRFEKISLQDVRADEVQAAQPLLVERLQHLESYMTAFLPTGATFADLDGDGFYDEACTTDGFSRKIRIHQLPVNEQPHQWVELPVPTEEYGIEGVLPSGSLAGDFNGDGKTDLLVYFWGRTPVVYLNEGQELAAESFRRVELTDSVERWYTQSAAQGDIDGDGDLDLVFANYFPDESKVLNDNSTSPAVGMNHGYGAAFNGAVNRLLVRTDAPIGQGWFRDDEIFVDPEISGSQWTIAVAVTDLDGDLLPEVIFLNDHGVDRILHNRSQDGQFSFTPLRNPRDLTTPKSSTFGRDDYHAMGVDFGDLNQDGKLDWIVSNFGADYLFHQSHFAWINTGEDQLYSQGRAPFADQSESLGIARTSGVPWDVRCIDFDNDGKLEIYRSIGFMRGRINRMPELTEMAMQNDLVFQFPEAWHTFGPDDSLVAGARSNAFCVWSNQRYVDIGEELGMTEPGVSRGMASGDVDFDGRVDFLVTNQRASSTFYQNVSRAGSFVGLDLQLEYTPEGENTLIQNVGETLGNATRAAIGASVVVHLPGGKSVASVVDGGSGFGGKKLPLIHVGLGNDVSDSERIELEVGWRDLSGIVHHQTLHVTPGWHRVLLRDGDNTESVTNRIPRGFHAGLKAANADQ